ncbi:hypothetical protein E4U32_008045 [Claviceps aff. humidiphila group G2b]|nr:hypothetical protein E4U32_008045 [Claviceps aff. humidiphila group G2b]
MTTTATQIQTHPVITSLSSINTHLQHEPSSPCLPTTPRTACRSVKSIVAWLESSSAGQQWSPGTTVGDMSHDLSTSSLPTYHRQARPEQQGSGVSEVEEYSLTYLRYRTYFSSAPLGRCLDKSQENDNSSPRGRPTGGKLHASRRRRRAGGCGSSIVGRDHISERHTGQPVRTAVAGFVQRDPDEVRAF